ncbi:hypothetical protein GWK08_05175 [Leptobacterium flavescens]|uniref:Intradiol ring-cleavage dioxygenases domain-containing protein n=1 Tax=Leptobacterium flavescens TaxID=472055 RepID=A0A6P0UHK8_9FLAO|nr:hypothetical protein [Leptobacterium flavescens]NER12821.1 hypothetical protein [Leptobacterium flavescens]
MKNISRKSFLSRLGLGLLSVPLAVKGVSAAVKEPKNDDTDCGYTDSASEGPFFVRNTIETVNLNFTNLPGTPMRISGTVFGDEEGKRKVADAKIEIWHCDDEGTYHPTGNGDISRYKDSEVALRGFVISDKQGAFSFKSITPGLYYGRRRHIHYKISAKGYRSLTTQSYWLNEKGGQRERLDRTDRGTEDCRYIDFKNNNGISEGVFNIYLKKA